MSRSFIHWSSQLEENKFWQFGKLATLYFAETVYQLSGTGLLGNALDRVVSNGSMSQQVADELLRLWKPADSVVPSYKLLDAIRNESVTIKVAGGIDTASGLADQPTQQTFSEREMTGFGDQPDAPRPDYRVVGTVVVWSALNALEPHALLTDMQNSSLIEKMFSTGTGGGARQLFSIVAGTTVPDLNELPWETVLQWRSTSHQENLRRAMTEAQAKLTSLDMKGAIEAVREIGRSHLRTMSYMDDPRDMLTSFKVVISNVPLPMPVYPVVTTVGLNDRMRNKQWIDKLGWLYLLMYTPSKPKQDRRLQ